MLAWFGLSGKISYCLSEYGLTHTEDRFGPNWISNSKRLNIAPHDRLDLIVSGKPLITAKRRWAHDGCGV